MTKLFEELLGNLNIKLTEEQTLKLDKYYELLVEWNEKINLTSIIEKEEVFIKHFYDSLCLLKGIKIDNQKLLDVGSGAGFPSLPLKIVFPNLDVTIIDALNKYNIPADRIIIEITEDIMIKGIDDVKPILRKLRELNLKISLDDFGTGYSSLNYLIHFYWYMNLTIVFDFDW